MNRVPNALQRLLYGARILDYQMVSWSSEPKSEIAVIKNNTTALLTTLEQLNELDKRLVPLLPFTVKPFCGKCYLDEGLQYFYNV